MENFSEEKLIKQYLRGDKKSLEILINQYLKIVYSFALHIVHDESVADDITQEVFVRAWKNLRKFDVKKNFKTWILSITKNAAIDYLRKKKVMPFSAFDNNDGGNAIADAIVDPAAPPDEIMERADTSQLLKTAMEQLSENYRTVLYLKYYSQLTFQKISEVLGVSINTVKSRHRRALAVLKELIAENL
ncbi:MAG: RNA polymerase sigma factor [Patescibacteria group bacterium]